MPKEFKKSLELLPIDIKNLIDQAKTEQDVEKARISILGKKGRIAAFNEVFQQFSLEDKKIFGPVLKDIRQQAEDLINHRKMVVALAAINEKRLLHQSFDVTLEKPHFSQGSIHPLTLVTNQLESIFQSMGFEIVKDRELEDDWHNFTALNIPANHPARDAHDTFWINEIPGHLLRTHTSTVQIRTMKSKKPPFAIFSAGRVFRNEATDASHDFQFLQGEPLLIDKNISIANLLSCAEHFLQTFFNNNTLTIRVRPSYFPFVEPGLEIDLECPFCKTGCGVCKKTRWIEIMGAGLVHPHVLESTGIDHHEYSGFAMGFGISRLTMLKYGINDVRLLHGNNHAFLSQFTHLGY